MLPVSSAYNNQFLTPIGNKFPFYTPYQFGGSSPIQFVDLDGAEPQIPFFEKFKYGDNVALNSVKAIPNAATSIVNGGIGLLNTVIYNTCMCSAWPNWVYKGSS